MIVERIHNNRDKIREYSKYHYYHHYISDIEKYEFEQKKYYTMKEKLLTLIDPVAIHHNERYDEYYLFYDFGYFHSFHKPIQYDSINDYHLPVFNLTELKTYGKEPTELISVQFIRKVLTLIETKKYTLLI